MDVVRITDDSARAEIAAAIKALRAKQRRLPAHYEDQREEIAVELEVLVAMWLSKAPQ